MLNKDNSVKYTVIMTKTQTGKVTKHLLHCLFLNWENKHSTRFFTSMIEVFIFRCADNETQDYYYFADRPARDNFPDCWYNKKLSDFHLRKLNN